MRMQIANNIGNAGDEQIMKMLTLEHIVVSVPAGTEIYIVFEKSAGPAASSANKINQAPAKANGFIRTAVGTEQ